MNITGKLIFALVIVTNLVATGFAAHMRMYLLDTPTIQLAKVVVAPANAEPEVFDLTPITVTPIAEDWRDAKARGVNSPAEAPSPVSNSLWIWPSRNR